MIKKISNILILKKMYDQNYEEVKNHLSKFFFVSDFFKNFNIFLKNFSFFKERLEIINFIIFSNYKNFFINFQKIIKKILVSNFFLNNNNNIIHYISVGDKLSINIKNNIKLIAKSNPKFKIWIWLDNNSFFIKLFFKKILDKNKVFKNPFSIINEQNYFYFNYNNEKEKNISFDEYVINFFIKNNIFLKKDIILNLKKYKQSFLNFVNLIDEEFKNQILLKFIDKYDFYEFPLMKENIKKNIFLEQNILSYKLKLGMYFVWKYGGIFINDDFIFPKIDYSYLLKKIEFNFNYKIVNEILEFKKSVEIFRKWEQKKDFFYKKMLIYNKKILISLNSQLICFYVNKSNLIFEDFNKNFNKYILNILKYCNFFKLFPPLLNIENLNQWNFLISYYKENKINSNLIISDKNNYILKKIISNILYEERKIFEEGYFLNNYNIYSEKQYENNLLKIKNIILKENNSNILSDIIKKNLLNSNIRFNNFFKNIEYSPTYILISDNILKTIFDFIKEKLFYFNFRNQNIINSNDIFDYIIEYFSITDFNFLFNLSFLSKLSDCDLKETSISYVYKKILEKKINFNFLYNKNNIFKKNNIEKKINFLKFDSKKSLISKFYFLDNKKSINKKKELFLLKKEDFKNKINKKNIFFKKKQNNFDKIK